MGLDNNLILSVPNVPCKTFSLDNKNSQSSGSMQNSQSTDSMQLLLHTV